MKEWMKNIRKVEPYTPGEQPQNSDVIKLNTNECPYPPAPGVFKAIKDIDPSLFRKYPNAACEPLVSKLAEYYGLPSECVFAGVGSDDVISVAFQTFFNSDKPLLFPDITYSFYPVWADLYNVKYETKPLDKDYHIVKEDYYTPNGGIIFPNPNAPTSVAEELSVIRDILDHNQESVVIIDEAYVDFGCESAVSLIKDYDNLLVVQTFSKSRSMAGMRIGYAMGNKDLIKAMNDVKYSINSINLSGVMSDKFELRKADGTKVTVGGENGMKFSESQLYEMIESGEYILYSKQVTDADDYAAHSTSGDYSVVAKDDSATVYYKWAATSVSGNTQLAIESDTTELAKAEADYNAKTLKINNKEKLLDNDLKALDTEHNALTTEMDSIKSLIGDNVEKTFNLFS